MLENHDLFHGRFQKVKKAGRNNPAFFDFKNQQNYLVEPTQMTSGSVFHLIDLQRCRVSVLLLFQFKMPFPDLIDGGINQQLQKE